MARVRRLHATDANPLEWHEGRNLPHVLERMLGMNQLPQYANYPPMQYRPEESSLALAHLGEQLHGIQITKSNDLEDIDYYPEPDPPYEWSFHRLTGTDPNDYSHWEEIYPDYGWVGGGGVEPREKNDVSRAITHVNHKWPYVHPGDGEEYTIHNNAWTLEQAKQRAEEGWRHYVEILTNRRDEALSGGLGADPDGGRPSTNFDDYDYGDFG